MLPGCMAQPPSSSARVARKSTSGGGWPSCCLSMRRQAVSIGRTSRPSTFRRSNYLPLPAAAMKVQTFTRWAKAFDRWLARTQRLDLPAKTDGDPVSLGPKRGGVSVELVAIVWELT